MVLPCYAQAAGHGHVPRMPQNTMDHGLFLMEDKFIRNHVFPQHIFRRYESEGPCISSGVPPTDHVLVHRSLHEALADRSDKYAKPPQASCQY